MVRLQPYLARLIVVLVTALYMAPLGSEVAAVTRVGSARRRNEERSASQISHRGNHSHDKSAASPKWTRELRLSYYYLTLAIQFDDYAYDIAWWIQDERFDNITTRLGSPYENRSRGDSVKEIIGLDDYEPYFHRNTEEERGATFRFVMVDHYGDGLRRGGYYHLSFTDAVERERTELARASRFGPESVVSFTLGVPEQETAVRVLDSRLSTVEEPTASPTTPRLPSNGMSSLRLKLDNPEKELSWQLSGLDPQTLSAIYVVEEGQYSGREDGEFHSIIELEGAGPYEFALTDYSPDDDAAALYDLTYVPSRFLPVAREVRMFLSKKVHEVGKRTDAIHFMVDFLGGRVYLATRGPTVEPTLEPTSEPTTLKPTLEPTLKPTLKPTVEPTLEPTLVPSVSPAPTSENPTIMPLPQPTANPPVDDSTSFDPVLFLLCVGLIIAFLGISFIYTSKHCLNRNSDPSPGASDNSNNMQVEQADCTEPDTKVRRIKENLLVVPIACGTEAVQCAICLVEYKDGDLVCFSANSQCEHKFHQDCMMGWLKNHEECPCCRLPYLPDEDRDEF